jgi:hypothetical protein
MWSLGTLRAPVDATLNPAPHTAAFANAAATPNILVCNVPVAVAVIRRAAEVTAGWMDGS